MKIHNWGMYPRVDVPVLACEGPQSLQALAEGSWIPRGMGRCYGDSALGQHILSSQRLRRFLAFDPQSGLLHCESGITYEDLLTHFVPKGWFPPVTPGTKFVSLGGAIASDVHGKNHHKEGSIQQHVDAFHLLLASGEVVHCSRTEHPDLFHATFGGMGLTGMILDLQIRLRPIETSAIWQESIKAPNLDRLIELFDESKDVTYSVAWIDVLSSGKKMGRSVLLNGEHATLDQIKGSSFAKKPLGIPQKLKLAVPFHFPSFALNALSVRAFNFAYYHKQGPMRKEGLADYDSFFYPLDAIHHWNRIYGKRGFTQYQFVVPYEGGAEAIRKVLKRTQQDNLGSFLAVLKTFGKENGWLSFPMEGYTLTLDFPISKKLFPILDELDAIVMDHGGRVYLTKDVRLNAQNMQKMYPEYGKFSTLLQKLDPKGTVRSFQSERIGLHPETVLA
ncbi:MAG: FAD-binding oxidoreductase [Bacteroidota bacterium]